MKLQVGNLSNTTSSLTNFNNSIFPTKWIDQINNPWDGINKVYTIPTYLGHVEFGGYMNLEKQVDKDGSLKIYFDVPGVKSDKLFVDVLEHKNIINVLAERSNRLKNEILKTSFSTPEGYDIKTLEADLEDGVLILTLKKSEDFQPKKININIKK